jgi:hypothetical protein
VKLVNCRPYRFCPCPVRNSVSTVLIIVFLQAGIDRRLNNFTTDIIDSELYTYLLNQIAPKEAGVGLYPLTVQGNVPRAGAMLGEADKLDCREFVTPNDVANGNYKLNLAFVANLFNKHPALPDPGVDELGMLLEFTFMAHDQDPNIRRGSSLLKKLD